METEVGIQSPLRRVRVEKYKKSLLLFGITTAILVLGYAAFHYYWEQRAWEKIRFDEQAYTKKNQRAYLDGLIKNDPKALQDSFVNDLEHGINDKFTKSDAYFITHRYFDNGGNIYEIYDYVNSHESLAFLKEAELIYPSVFDQIEHRTLTTIPYSTPSLYALLAYLETLDKHGYADIAALGTLANQYAKTAYFIKKRFEKGDTNGDMTSSVVNLNIRKSLFFAIKAKESLIKISEDSNGTVLEDIKNRPKLLREGNLKGVLEHDFLVGMSQYAAALRYLKAAGADISAIGSPVTASEVFAFNMTFSRRFVPELEIFTSLLNASTLSLDSSASPYELEMALRPLLNFDTSKTKPFGIITGIIDARNSKFTGLDIYSKINIATLANKVPKFKAWLASNGWGDGDFRL